MVRQNLGIPCVERHKDVSCYVDVLTFRPHLRIELDVRRINLVIRGLELRLASPRPPGKREA